MSDGENAKPKTEALPQGPQAGKPTAEMTAAPKPEKSAGISKTITDEGGVAPVAPAATADTPEATADPPWNKGGKTMPGEPPLMDPAAFGAPPAFPPPQQPVPPMAAPAMAPPMMAPGMAPRPGIGLPPPPPPQQYKRGGGSGLLIGTLVGVLAILGGIIAVVLIVQSREDSDPAPQTLDIPTAGATTEVKPEATVEPTVDTPPPSTPEEPVAVAPTPKPTATYKPTPKPTATTPPPQPTATTPPTQPTSTQPSLPPPPPPQPTTKSTGGRLKLPKKH